MAEQRSSYVYNYIYIYNVYISIVFLYVDSDFPLIPFLSYFLSPHLLYLIFHHDITGMYCTNSNPLLCSLLLLLLLIVTFTTYGKVSRPSFRYTMWIQNPSNI